MDNLNKEQLEAELLLAQKKKVEAETEVIKKTTPITEAIKTVGSLIVGIGGIVVAIFGFQLAEVKAEKFKLEAEKATMAKDSAEKDMLELTALSDKQKADIKIQDSILSKNANLLELLSDKIPADSNLKRNSMLANLKQDINAAALELRESSMANQPTGYVKPMSTLIEEMYHPKASVRGAAYNQLVNNYANSTVLVPTLLAYANNHLDNLNGTYNTLVLFSRIDYKKVPRDVPAIKAFANKTKNNGPLTADRVKKLMERMPAN